MGFTPGQRHIQNHRRIEIEHRRRTVAANLLAGATYAEIARALNVSKSTVASDSRAITEAWRTHYTDTADRYIMLQLRRLDTLLNAVWTDAAEGSLPALDRVLAIIDRQNAMLGINRPTLTQGPAPQQITIVEVNRLPDTGD